MHHLSSNYNGGVGFCIMILHKFTTNLKAKKISTGCKNIMQNVMNGMPIVQIWSSLPIRFGGQACLHVSRNSVKPAAESLQVRSIVPCAIQGSYALQIELVQFMSPDLGDGLHRFCGMKRSIKHLQLLLIATAWLYLSTTYPYFNALKTPAAHYTCYHLQIWQRCTEPGRPL